MDEKELKNLLDEAITYKNPRDANDKSDTFKVSFQFYFFHNKISYHNLFSYHNLNNYNYNYNNSDCFKM